MSGETPNETGIGAQSRLHAMAADAQSLLSAVCNTTTAALFITDAARRCCYMNNSATALTGYAPSEIEGEPLNEIIRRPPPDGTSEPAAPHPVERALLERRRIEGEGVFVHKNGDVITVAYVASPVEDKGEIVGAVLELRDLRAEKEAVERGLSDDAILAAMFETAALGIAHADLDGRYLQVNHRHSELLGYEKAELEGKTYQDITHPDDIENDRRHMNRMLSGDISEYKTEKRYIRKDGQVIWVALSAHLLRTEAGTPLCFFATIDDITEKRLHADRMAMLTQELNHRVKNTLATVQAIAQLSFHNAVSPELGKKAFIERVENLAATHDLLAEENWESADIRMIVSRTLEPFFNGDERAFVVDGPSVDLPPRASLALAMALNELGVNALKYGALTTPAGRISVVWRLAGAAGDRSVEFSWIERGGPPVSPPTHKGFGTILLQEALPSELCGECRLDYPVEGVEFTCIFPAAEP